MRRTRVPGLPAELILLEDRNVFVGLAHFYRIRAYDDLEMYWRFGASRVTHGAHGSQRGLSWR